jgi:hypothetical protein
MTKHARSKKFHLMPLRLKENVISLSSELSFELFLLAGILCFLTIKCDDYCHLFKSICSFIENILSGTKDINQKNNHE